MEQRGMVESGGAALACVLAAAATFQVLAGRIDWVLVVGIGLCAGIAGAANYQARTKHAEKVADEAPVEAADTESTGGDAVDAEPSDVEPTKN